MSMDSMKSEVFFRTVFDCSRSAIILADLNGIILDVNQTCVDLFGYETAGRFLSDRKSVGGIFKDSQSFLRFQQMSCKDVLDREFEFRLVGRKDREFDAVIKCSLVTNEQGEDVGRVLILRDSSKNNFIMAEVERRRNIRLGILKAVSNTISSSLDLDKILENTVNKMIEILETDSVRIYLLDDDRQVLHLAAYKGFTKKFMSKPWVRSREKGDGILGQTVITGRIRVVDNFSRAEDPYVNSFIEEGLKATAYIPLRSKGKPVGVMAVSSHSMIKFSDYHVELLHSIGNQIGISVENANLYAELSQAYHELKMAQEQVIRSEKLASLGKLSASIAHEINNPLSAVLTYNRLIMKLIDRNKFTAEKLADISRYLKTMESETFRCGEIVKNLLAFSRQSGVTIEANNIERIIDRTLDLIIHDMEIRQIRLEKVIEPDLPPVECDFKQMEQAFLNLMVNASESMSEGGTLTVTVRRSEKTGFVEVMIRDTGCGISKEDQKKIFEPFFTTKKETKGVGLGLSVVFGIITRHKGIIEVESELRKGTTFRVHLPASQ
ncbi:MAG: hypothetical protein DRH37_01850 [Deltaproteobacteria bacterium]|nr:MAG: hypothetical protein DRH37_01850 [Deltaproteobacteria bacterium]